MVFAYILIGILGLFAVVMIGWTLLRIIAGIICAINNRIYGTWYGKMPWRLQNIVEFFSL